MADAESLPTRGAWIEIQLQILRSESGTRRSPRGERGLKYYSKNTPTKTTSSLPTRGAWIEMDLTLAAVVVRYVAPHAGSVD